MKIQIQIKLLLLLIPIFTFGQVESVKPKVDINTIYATIDSISYSKLFENSFVKDTLFFCKNGKSTTDKESYSGKYLIGNSATIEFFAPKNTSFKGDTFGDMGIEFKTRKVNQLSHFENNKTKTETVFSQIDSLKIPWYKALALDMPPPHLEVSLLEYQKEYLTYLGFSEEEINTEMTYDTYNSLLSGGKKYPRKFNSIKAIELELNLKELNYLTKTIENMEGTSNYNQLQLNGFKINYNVTNVDHFKIKKIIIDLLEKVPTKTIVVSKNIKIKTKEKIAEIQFNY